MPTAKQVYSMLDNQTLWEVASDCEHLMSTAEIPHMLCGGVAVCLHGYQRNTVDIDLIIRKTDANATKELLQQAGYTWHVEQAEFRSDSGVAVQFLYAGDRACRDIEVYLPEPEGDQVMEQIEGLCVLRLSKLIETKIASGLGNLRRTHKDFADVVELIAIRKLDGKFAGLLHPAVRKTFRKLLKHAQEES